MRHSEAAQVILPFDCDFGGVHMRRALPAAPRQAIGPIIVLDQLAPRSGAGVDLSAHPHVGLVKATYLLGGNLVHHDSLGNVASLREGDLGWLSAGRGVTHSEHAAPPVSGVQFWLALPHGHEEDQPFFRHVPKDSLPHYSAPGIQMRVVAGTLFGRSSPVAALSDVIIADIALEAGAVLPIPWEHEEQAIYILEGQVQLGSEVFPASELLVPQAGTSIAPRAVGGPARFLLVGGAKLDGPRHLWWTFVADDEEGLDRARADWREGRFDRVAGEDLLAMPDYPKIGRA